MNDENQVNQYILFDIILIINLTNILKVISILFISQSIQFILICKQ